MQERPTTPQTGTMDEDRQAPVATAKPKRASRGQVRVWAWTTAALSFLAPWAYFGVHPKPASGATTAPPQSNAPTRRRPVVLIITKKVIYTQSSAPSVSSSGGGSVNYVYAPSAPPVAVSCGTHPC